MKTSRKNAVPRIPVRARQDAPPATVSTRSARWPEWLLSIGAVLLILHGIIELLPAFIIFSPAVDYAPEFIIEDLAANWQMTLGFSIVCGLLRLAAGAGILRKMLWGWLLGIILSIITFTVLTWYLPMGVMDAVFSGPVLLLLLIGRYPDTKISG